MKKHITINPHTRGTYLPKDIVDNGFTGKVNLYSAGSVVVVVHPNSDITNAIASLKLVIKDIELTPQVSK